VLNDWLTGIAEAIAGSSIRQMVIDLLSSVPGLPPGVQTLHILAIAVVVAAFVVPNLKILGIAAQGQSYDEMLSRLRPWAWSALGVLLLSGAVFVIARPFRYFFNPVVGTKFTCLAVALCLTVVVQNAARTRAPVFPLVLKAAAALTVLAWFAVIVAGRWIAYVDYLFWEE